MTYRRLVGFGEAMLRLTAPVGYALETATGFASSVGGAELNGLIAAALNGMPGRWVSALPDGPLGRLVLRHARSNGVEPVLAGTDDPETTRLGLYFLEMTAPPRPLRITYDRSGSAFGRLAPETVRWDELLASDACLYLTGITPALGSGPRKAMDDALRVAHDVGATVALDVNYRSALWTREDASAWLASVLPEVDVLSTGIDDLRDAGVEGVDPLAEAVERFGLRAAVTVSKRRVDAAMEIEMRVVTASGEHRAQGRAVVVDPIGSGDALFGTFLAHLPAGDVATATGLAVGAAVTCQGLLGDALVSDPWDESETRGVIR